MGIPFGGTHRCEGCGEMMSCQGTRPSRLMCQCLCLVEGPIQGETGRLRIIYFHHMNCQIRWALRSEGPLRSEGSR